MLNPAQQRAVEVDGHALITACPGSGKTHVLAHRAAHLLQKHSGARLAAATFTAEAAGELESRIVKYYPEAASRVTAGTFHSLARQQLLAAGRRVKLLREHEIHALIKRAWESVGATIPLESAAAAVERCKSTLNAVWGSADDDTGIAIYERYQQFLHELHAMDFQDLIIESVRGMRDGTIAPLSVDYLLVDEFQDTDDVQLEWTKSHIVHGVQVTAVGDDDQAIYGWRWAGGHGALMAFREETNATLIQLEKTYRCAPQIIDCASRLIRHNIVRVAKTLETNNHEPGRVEVTSAETREGEAALVAATIAAHKEPGSWAVLARSNKLLDAVEGALWAKGIPPNRVGGKSLWDHQGPSLLVSALQGLWRGEFTGIDVLLRASHLHHDDLVAIRPRHGRGEGSVGSFLDGPLPDGLRDPDFVSGIRELGQEWLCNIHKPDREHLTIDGVAEWIDRVVPRRSLGAPAGFAAPVIKNMKGGLAVRLSKIEHGGSRKSKKKKGERAGPSLMTLHGSKGREFPNVWIIGVQRGILPHKSSTEDEERRLLYVGMTRAETSLYLSYVIYDGRGVPMFPSSFISEAGLELA